MGEGTWYLLQLNPVRLALPIQFLEQLQATHTHTWNIDNLS